MIDQGSDTPTQRLDLALVDESASATAADSLKARLLGIPDLALTPGTELGRFVLLAQIGAGGMGVVYAAYDPELDRKVAVKLVQTARERGPATRGRSRLLHEAQAMARLSHPNVIAVYETGTVGDQVFLAMEFVKGVTLAQWLRQAPRDWRAVVAAFVQAGRGLAAAHAAGIVHRDFKPDNALIDAQGRVRVLDFGLALRHEAPSHAAEVMSHALRARDDAEPPTTDSHAFTGTPAYMSPEQHRGNVGDVASDQYSLCVALYEALFGARPFVGETLTSLRAAVLRGQPAPPPGNKVPPWLRQVVLRGLSLDPARRWPNIDALLAELTRDRLRARRRIILALALAALASAGGLLYRWAVARGVAEAVAAREAACGDAEAQLAGVWDDERRSAVDLALRATGAPYAADASARVRAGLDAHAAAWADAHARACVAVQLRESGDAPNQRMHCLETQRHELRALVEVLARADAAAVEHAAAAVAGLTPPARCEDPSLYRLGPPPAAVASAVRDLRDRLAGARAQEVAGHFAAGLELAREARLAAEALAYRPLIAEARLREGVLEDMSGSYPAAEAALAAAAWTAEATQHDAVAIEAAIELVLVVGVRRARHGEANIWAALAQAVLERSPGDARPQQAGLWASIGALRLHEGRFAEARDMLTKALALYQEVLDPLALRLAQTHSDLGNALRMLGDYDAAIEHYTLARTIREQTLGPAHPQVAMVLNNLAVVHAIRGDDLRAEPYYRQAIAVWEAALGPDHPNLGHALNNLGSLLQERGALVEAHALASRALAVWERAYGPDHPDLVSPLITLGNVQNDQGALASAELTYRRAHALSAAALGPEHPDLGYTLVNLADVALKQGRVAEARRASERALTLFERAGTADDVIAEAKLGLMRIELAERRFAAVVALAEWTLPRLRANLPARGDAGFILAQALWSSGDRPRARAAASAARTDLLQAGRHAEVAKLSAWSSAHP